MPKKRFTNQYSKPPSTVHPSLNSTAASSSSSNQNDAPPSVNELIASLRRANVSSTTATAPATVITPTLPPQIRQLLSQPETPTPRPRDRRQRYDAAGRRLPPGPAPPRSWLESRHAPAALRKRERNTERLFPYEIAALPGISDQNGGRRLQDMCMRAMAKDWEFIREYEKSNLADLPTGVRTLLLSYIAVYGPEDGVGAEGLNDILVLPNHEEDAAYDVGGNNEGFFRLDLSGSVGRSVSFRQLIELVQKPATPPPEEAENAEISWEDGFVRSFAPTIPYLTHLSLSHPPSTISWPRLLTFSKDVPTLTHLSLAFWPVPSLTPNAKTAVMASPYGKDVQYGGANYYSHTLDDDFREAASILKRLANRTYNLEYLDLEGCADWLQALRWTGEEGLDWSSQWLKMKALHIPCGYVLGEDSEYWEVDKFTRDFRRMKLIQRFIPRAIGKGRWIEVEIDNWQVYKDLWKDGTEENNRKRKQLEVLKDNRWAEGPGTVADEAPMQRDVARRSVWEQ